MAGIRVANLVHAYRDGGREVRAVDDISFEVAENQFYTLLGPSGCGKTTTLRCVAGLEDPTSGEIDLDGVAVVSARGVVPTHRRPIGMVFQDYAVWPHMTVFQNVAFPLRVAGGTSRAEVRERVEEALALVGMEAYTQRRATQLSGGQQQRISLARALVRRPKVLLLDEPLSNLDAKLREQMRAELRSIQRLLRVTTIFVTHDQVEALAMSNRIAVMSAGRIVQEGTPREIYLEPNSRFVASFVGATTFVEGRVEPTEAQGTANLVTPLGMLRCAVHEPPRAGTDVTVAIRPESIRLTDEEVTGVNVFAGEIELALFNGESVDYRVRVESETIRVTGGGRTNYRRGDRVSLVAPPEECVIIADEGGASAVGSVATSDNASR